MAENWLMCVVAFSAVVVGAMGETLDGDLNGAIAAGVCAVISIIIIVSILACCCFRRLERKRKAEALRKIKSETTPTPNGVISPRWSTSGMPAHSMPVYTMPVPDPMMYGMSASPYALGNYAPKFVDAQTLECMQYDETGERRSRKHGSKHEKSQETQEVTTQEDTTTEVDSPEEDPQPNGHVVNEFASSSLNYRVIRKHHDQKHEKMPQWLRRSYGENERTMDIDDEDRASQYVAEDVVVVPPTPEQVVRAHVLPHHAHPDLDPDLEHVPPGFTIVDYIDPENGSRPSSTSGVWNNNEDPPSPPRLHDEEFHVTIITTNDDEMTPNIARVEECPDDDVLPNMARVEECPDDDVIPESSAHGIVDFPPSDDDDDEEFYYDEEHEEGDDLGEMKDRVLYHRRMRNPGQGSVQILPDYVAHLATAH